MNPEISFTDIADTLPRYDHFVRHGDGSVGVVTERLDGTMICAGYDIIPNGTRSAADVALHMSSIIVNLAG